MAAIDIRLNITDLLQGLVSEGRLGADEADRIRLRSRTTEQRLWHPTELIAEADAPDLQQPGERWTLERLSRWLSDHYGQPYFHIDPLKIETQEVTGVVSREFAERHQILVVEVTEREVHVVSAEPEVTSWEALVEQSQPGKTVRRLIANPADIRRYTAEFYAVAQSVKRASAQGLTTSGLNNLEQMLVLGELDGNEANDTHIVNIVDWLLQYAFDQRASDIHIEPRRDKGSIRFRIDGVLHTVYELPPAIITAVVSRIKTLGRMNVAEKRRPQDGRLKTRSQSGREVELRLSTLPTAHGEKMVLRIFDPSILVKTFAELGFTEAEQETWESLVGQPNGIVLVTGPTGSGKTTTLYTSLKQLATESVNVCTIEDPIEMVEPAFNQMQVQHNIDLTFAEGVRALLRQDPDIIMVGEIRDLETAEMAIQAALTGHLVISTLHTNDAPSAITRLLELGVPPYLIKATVLGVMAQRLVRTLCNRCAQSSDVDSEDIAALLGYEAPADREMLYRSEVGCEQCRDTGFHGRAGIYELLTLSPKIKALIDEQTDIDAIRLAAEAEGMQRLAQSGATKVMDGQTTMSEVLRVVPSVISKGSGD
jgi:general secretion pathway protein E